MNTVFLLLALLFYCCTSEFLHKPTQAEACAYGTQTNLILHCSRNIYVAFAGC
jgi:hypothetical protein